MNKKLTIVIPSKNEGKLLIETLSHLVVQSEKYKIIVADSSDETESIYLLKTFQESFPKQIKIVSGGLPAVARNKGYKEVKTDYVLFLDADVFVMKKDLLYHCLEQMMIGGYDLLTCKFKTVDGKFDWVYKLFSIVQWVSSKTTPFALGGFMMFKSSTFEKLGKFYEEDKIAEDYHLSSKVKKRKFKITDLHVYTVSRRFEKKGLWYMTKLLFLCWINRNNDNFFKKDFNYWK